MVLESNWGGGFSVPSGRLFRRFNSAVAPNVKKQGYFWGHLSRKKKSYDIGNMVCTDIRCLTTEIRSEKCIVRRFCRRANVVECAYTNLR